MFVATLPPYFTVTHLNDFTGKIIGFDGHPVSEKITIDFAGLAFIDGGGLTVLENSMAWLRSFGVAVSFANHNRPTRDAICYLDDCGFFKKQLGASLRTEAAVRSTTIPCDTIINEFRHSWLQNKFVPWIASTMGMPERAFDTLKNCLVEIFNNIVEHSLKNSGFVHVQHYPNKNLIKITVSDFGRGIPNAIRTRYPQMDDATAIEFSTREGVSSQSFPTNKGMGLSILRNAAALNKMDLTIQSYRGRLSCNSNRQGIVTTSKFNFDSYYPGTLIEFGFKTHAFVGDEITEKDLEW